MSTETGRRRRGFVALSVLAGVAICPLDARCAETNPYLKPPLDPAPVAHRFLVGSFVGVSSLTTSVDGKEYESEFGKGSGGFMLAFDERLLPALSLGARAGASWLASEPWSHDRISYDLGLQPKLWAPLGRWDFFLGALGGVSLSSVQAPEHRGFAEQTEAPPGYHLGASIGTIFPRRTRARIHSGLLLELGYLYHSTNVEARLTPTDPTLEASVEDWEYSEGLLYFSVGYALGFGSL